MANRFSSSTLLRRALVIIGAALALVSALPPTLLLEIAGWNPTAAEYGAEAASSFKAWGSVVGWIMLSIGIVMTLGRRKR